MKKLIVVILSLVLVLSLVACGGGETAQPDLPQTGETEAVTEAAPAATDLSKIDAEVTFGDVAAMEALRQKIGNFEAENAVVKIEGEFEKLGTSYSIMEREEGFGIGLNVVVDGWSDADYPEDYTRVQILGVVVTEGWSHYISVLPENFTVVTEN